MSLGVSQILSDTFARVRARFFGLVGLWFVFFAITMGATVAFMAVIGGSAMALAGSVENESTFGAMGAGMMLAMVLFYALYLLIAVAQYAALNAMASPLRDAGFGESISAGLRSSPTLLAVMIILLVGYFAGTLAFGALLGMLSQFGTAAAVVAAIVLFLGVMYLACRLSIVFPIVPVEEIRNPISAIGRSWSLTRGNALPIFLSLLVFMVIMAVLVAIVLIPAFGSFAAMAEGDTAPAIGTMLIMMLGFFVIAVLFVISYSAMLSSIHARLAPESAVAGTFD